MGDQRSGVDRRRTHQGVKRVPEIGALTFSWNTIQRLGVGVVASLYLMWWITARVDRKIDELLDLARAEQVYNRLICVNTARDDIAARRCEQVQVVIP